MTTLSVNKVSDLRVEALMAQDDARQEIDAAMDKHGPFTHNIISIILRNLSEKYGTEWANDLVIELNLADQYNIVPHK